MCKNVFSKVNLSMSLYPEIFLYTAGCSKKKVEKVALTGIVAVTAVVISGFDCKTKEPNVEKKEKKKEKEKSEGSREAVCAETNLYPLTISKKLNNSSKKYWPDMDGQFYNEGLNHWTRL